MKTIETVVYTFNELSEEAKDKARAWYLEGSDDSQYAYDDAIEDAKNIGLDIDILSDRLRNKGQFLDDAESCAKLIIENHGKDCETYKTARAFLLSLDSLNDEYHEDEDGQRVSDIDGRDNYDDEREELEKEFLHSILEDYKIMFEKKLRV